MRLFRSCIILIFLLFILSCNQNKTAAPIAYLEINLNDSFSNNPFARKSSPLEVFRIIEKASQDSNINGIILNIGSINRSREYLWELRCALEQFKAAGEPGGAGKKIVAYINNADIDVYMLASVADKIVMDELGFLTIVGYSAGKGYVSQTLEKIGIGVAELRYFEYKSAAESYTRTNMSEADRRQYSDYLDDIFNHTRSVLTEARGWTANEFDSYLNRNFIHSAANALTHNLVDYVGGSDAVKEAIKIIEDQIDIDYFLYGVSGTSLIGTKIYSAPRVRSSDTIAVIYADGETDMTRGMEIGKLTKIIGDLEKNNRVKAIVVRMNSPGGSAQAADALAEAIRYARGKKPVVVSMGQLAASGGYWASMTANHIMATPYTITGSIGVIASFFYDNGLYNKLGVDVDVLKRGDHSDFMTGFLIPYRRLTEQEEEQYKKYILDLYDVFIGKVAAGRNMETDRVEAIAQGRIFSGKRALDEGLIDSIGGLYDAVNLARNLAMISENVTVSIREYPEPGFMDLLLGRFSVKSAPSLIDLFTSDTNINYRLENNGKIMPILPLDFSVF